MKLKNLFNNVFGEVVEEEGLGNNVLNTDAASEVELEPESQQEEVKSLPQQDEVHPQPQPEEEPQPQPKKEKKEKPVETAKPEDRTMFELLRNDIRFQISEVLNALMSLKLEMKAKDELLDKQEETIRRQSQTISKFQDDLLYKIQKPLIMEMVEIADNIRLILNDKEIIENKDFEALIDRIEKLEDWVAASLSNNSVRRYSLTSESPSSLDRKKQEVIDVEFTNDPAKDATYFTERPGYIWSMPYLIINSDIQLKKALEDAPKSFEFIIRPEEVVKYKYQKSEENQ